MNGLQWRWRQTGLPPWLGAVLTVGAILLVVNALPMIASTIAPDRATFVPTSGPPEPIPLPGTAAGTATGDQVDPAAPPAPQPLRKPLPISGGNAVPALALGGVLLAGGAGLLMMVGFTGAGPWPGRYVRRMG